MMHKSSLLTLRRLLLIAGAYHGYSDAADSSQQLLDAVQRGATAQVLQLVSQPGIQLDARNEHGQTPLHLAALYDNTHLIDILLNAGAQVDPLDERARTPLLDAVSAGFKQSAQRLLQAGASATTRDASGATLLAYASMHPRGLDLIERLAEHNALLHINEQSGSGTTPLHEAAQWGGPDVVRYLLTHGAAIDAQDHRLKTPLHMAIERHRTENVGVLVRRGAQVDIPDNTGRTALDITSALPRNAALRRYVRRQGLTELDGPADHVLAADDAQALIVEYATAYEPENVALTQQLIERVGQLLANTDMVTNARVQHALQTALHEHQQQQAAERVQATQQTQVEPTTQPTALVEAGTVDTTTYQPRASRAVATRSQVDTSGVLSRQTYANLRSRNIVQDPLTRREMAPVEQPIHDLYKHVKVLLDLYYLADDGTLQSEPIAREQMPGRILRDPVTQDSTLVVAQQAELFVRDWLTAAGKETNQLTALLQQARVGDNLYCLERLFELVAALE